MWGKIKFDSQRRYDGDQLNQFFQDLVLVFEERRPIPVPPDGVQLSVRSADPLLQKRLTFLPVPNTDKGEA